MSAEILKKQINEECEALIAELRKINDRINELQAKTRFHGPAIDAEQNINRAMKRLQAQMEAKI